MEKLIIASDSWKGSLSSHEVNAVVADTIGKICPYADIIRLDISDGGEGFCDAVTQTLGGLLVEVETVDPLLRPIKTHYGVLPDGTAVADVASTVGLTMLSAHERNPLVASSRGVGMLLCSIIEAGHEKIVIGLGGSATNDCGRGMMEVLENMCGVDSVEFVVATDVSSPLCGPTGATYTYALQKGATPDMLPWLEERNRRYGRLLEQHSGRDIVSCAGAGAAGGIGAALMSLPRCRLERGIDFLLDLYHFDHLLSDAMLVITGEGCIDNQTLQGKAPFGIAKRSQQKEVPCLALCGQADPDLIASPSPWKAIIPVSPPHADPETMMQPDTARRNIAHAITEKWLSCSPMNRNPI